MGMREQVPRKFLVRLKRLRLGLCCLILAGWTALLSAEAHAVSPDKYEDDDMHPRSSLLVLNGAGQRHNFHAPGDEDWIRFYGLKGLYYYIKTGSVGARCSTVMELYDGMGQKVGDSDFRLTGSTVEGEEEDLAWECRREGVYYLRIRQASGEVFGWETGYALYVWDGDAPPFPAKLEGTIKDRTSGRGMEGVTVKLTSQSAGLTSCVSDSKGFYSIVKTGGATYRLTAAASGYGTYEDDVRLDEGERVKREILMAPRLDKPSNLVAEAISGPPEAVRGDTVSLAIRVKNVGKGNAGAFRVGIYLSADKSLKFGNDRCLAGAVVPKLAAGGTWRKTMRIRIPKDVLPGMYHVGALADPEKKVSETSRNDNCLFSKGTMIIR